MPAAFGNAKYRKALRRVFEENLSAVSEESGFTETVKEVPCRAIRALPSSWPCS
jgi:hypothetical protein